MTPFVATHAVCASLALILGPVNLVRRPYGDRVHRWLGRLWLLALYIALATSMFIRQLSPGRFSLFHVLTVFTFTTVTAGLWAATGGRIDMHRRMLRNSWFGVVGAFIGAVAVPKRDVPQLASHDPVLFTCAVVGLVGGCALLVVAAIWLDARRPDASDRVAPSPRRPRRDPRSADGRRLRGSRARTSVASGLGGR